MSEIVAGRETEPSVPILKVAADEETEFPAPNSESVSLEAGIFGQENLNSLWLSPRFWFQKKASTILLKRHCQERTKLPKPRRLSLVSALR